MTLHQHHMEWIASHVIRIISHDMMLHRIMICDVSEHAIIGMTVVLRAGLVSTGVVSVMCVCMYVCMCMC